MDKYEGRSKLLALLALVMLITGVCIAWAAWGGSGRVVYRTFVLNVSDGKLQSSESPYTLKRGETAKFVVNSVNQHDEADLLIRGYDLKAGFSTNSVGNLEFKATQVGIFDIAIWVEDKAPVNVAKLVVTQ